MNEQEFKAAHEIGMEMLTKCKKIYRKTEDADTAARQVAQEYVDEGYMKCPVEDLTGMLFLELMHHIKPNGELIE